MPIATFQLEDGREVEFEVPSGTTPEQANEIFAHWAANNPTVKENLSWAEVPGRAVANLPSSAARFAGNMIQPVLHPYDTVRNLQLAATGGLYRALPEAISKPMQDVLLSDADQKRSQDISGAIGEDFKSKYGSVEGFKRYLAEDPIGAISDMSALLGGAGVIAGGAGAPARVTSALNTASRATNPLSAVGAAPRVLGNASAAVLGITGQTGMDTVRQAFRSGATGEPTFIQHLRGELPISETVDLARTGLRRIREARGREYVQAQQQLRTDPAILDIDPVRSAVDDAFGVSRFGDFEMRQSVAGIKNRISEVVDRFGELYAADPVQYGSVLGMDALKQAIGDIRDYTDYHTPDRVVADRVYNAVRDQIFQQAPSYRRMMADYEAATRQINEIEKSLSLGNKSSIDTATRKLQSLTRNNVNTNYGYRQDLARELQAVGGVDLMPSVSGQAMGTYFPRTLAGSFENLSTLGASMLNPSLLAALPFQSPRLIGEAAHAAGRFYGPMRNNVAGLFASLPISPTLQELNAMAQAGKAYGY